jgi:hypothetical protein
MTISIKPTASGSTIEQDGSTVLSVESDRSVDIDSGTLHVDATNNRVGIGTSSPTAKLQVNTTGGGVFQVTDWGASSQIGTDAAGQALRINGVGSVRFHTGTAGSQAEAMRIDSSGSLLAGKTGLDTTNAGLWINSNIANGYGRINFIKGTSSGTGATASCGFYYNGTSVGTIVNTSTATAFNTSSDYRLKENVSPMSGSIDRLKQLKPSTWSWKLDGSHGEGFLAHEAQTVVPEAITGTHNEVDDDDNPVYQGIDQAKLVPLLTAALQEAITKIEDLETRIQALENA